MKNHTQPLWWLGREMKVAVVFQRWLSRGVGGGSWGDDGGESVVRMVFIILEMVLGGCSGDDVDECRRLRRVAGNRRSGAGTGREEDEDEDGG
ncbi:hypothetical protein Tco_0628031 [Tanacetum coccineum]|uniref:Uncharacterized protein n=1 Tax=Tanacetum coccineum TaxID=301880 RepID=A0ABQ4WP49_9ASTR